MSVKARKASLAQHLRRAILTCALEPGSDLDEVALCAQFELSRTPVREVLKELEGWGYVTLPGQRSPRVSDLSPTKLRDFFLAAPMIYGAILRLAARNRTAKQIKHLEDAQEVFDTFLHTGPSDRLTMANVRFHEVTGEMAGNAYLLPSFGRLLIDHARIGMTFYQPTTQAKAEALGHATLQHQEMIEAIRERDEEEAARLADAHWDLSRAHMESFVMPQGLSGGLGREEEGARDDATV